MYLTFVYRKGKLMQIREMDLTELYSAYELVSQLYETLSYEEFEDLVYDMRHIEYKMIGIFEKEKLISYAGVTIQTSLYYKRHLHVSDFFTDFEFLSKKYDLMLLEYLYDYARMGMCERVLFSCVSSQQELYALLQDQEFENRAELFVKTF